MHLHTPIARLCSFLPILIALGGCSQPSFDSALAPGIATSSSASGSTSEGSSGGGGTEGHATENYATDTSGLVTGASTDGEDGVSTETGATMEDLCEGECLVLPDAWNGPVVRLLGDEDNANEPADCDAAWPEQVGDVLHTNVTAGGASCDCECIETQAPVCGGQTGTLRMTTSCGASILEQTWNLSPGNNSTQSLPVYTNRSWRLTAPGTDTAAVCTPSDLTQELPELERIGKVRLCAAPEAGAEQCGDGTCVPPIVEPFGNETNLCVWREGLHQCPTTFPAEHTYYRDESDDRTCDGCSCTTQGDACTSARVTLQAPASAGPGAFVSTVTEGGCTSVAYAPSSFNFTPRAPNAGTCQVAAPSFPSGSVQAADPVTVCCRG